MMPASVSTAADAVPLEVVALAASAAAAAAVASAVAVSCSTTENIDETARTTAELVPLASGSDIESEALTRPPTSSDACTAAPSDTCPTTATTASTADTIWPTAAAVGAVAAAASRTISSTFSRICVASTAPRPPLPSASRALALVISAALAWVAACGSPLCNFSAARESTESTTAAPITGSGSTVASAPALAVAP